MLRRCAMQIDQTEHNKWRQPCIVLSIVLLALAISLLCDTPVQRARNVSSGMTRAEVHQIMGQPLMQFRVSDAELHLRLPKPVDGIYGTESAECWDYGGVPGRYVDLIKRKLGLLKSFKRRADYPVEIRFDESDRVVAVEIRERID